MRNIGDFVDLNPPDHTFIGNISRELVAKEMFQEFFQNNPQFWTGDAYNCYGDPLSYSSVAIHCSAGKGSDDAIMFSEFYQAYFRTLRIGRIKQW